MNWEREQREVAEIDSRIKQTAVTVANEERFLKDAEGHLTRAQDAQEILQRVAQAVQQQAHNRISEVVSSCLRAVFPDDPYEFKIVFERKRGKTEANLRFTRRGLDVDPLTASGGGVVDVASFALRVACLVLHRPRLSRLVVLDEPFKFVSADYRENVRGMLEELSQDLKLQIVMVSHIEELEAGKVIQL